MKINRFFFNNKDYVLEGEVDLSNYEFNPFHIRKITSCYVKVKGENLEDLLLLDVEIKAEVIGVCSLSLEDVPLSLNFKDHIEITNEQENEDDFTFYEKNNIFDFEPYVLSLVVSEVPTVIVKEGASIPKDGDGFRVISEEEYEKENENKKDPRWDVLDDIEVE